MFLTIQDYLTGEELELGPDTRHKFNNRLDVQGLYISSHPGSMEQKGDITDAVRPTI